MEQKPEEMDVADETTVESEKMECDEVLSGSEAAELTENVDSSDRVNPIEKKQSIGTESTSGIEVTSGSTSAPESPCEEEKADKNPSEVVPLSEEKPIVDQKTVSTEISPPTKKTLLSNIKEFFSPPKDPKVAKEKPALKSKSRSKSMSPSEKTQQVSACDALNPLEEACAKSEGEEEHTKKGNEKSGVIKSLKRHLSKIITKSKPTLGSDSANLVSDEETEVPIVVEKPEEKLIEIAGDAVEDPAVILQWTENRQSLTEKPSFDGTTMTDIPSTWSGHDVFSSETSSKHSTGENISEENVEGCLAGSPDEKVLDAQEDKDAGSESPKKVGSSAEEVQNVAETEKSPEKPSSLEKNVEKRDCKNEDNAS